MTLLTTIAVSTSIFVLSIGIATLFAGRGYRFDLRRRRKGHQAGGRRADDHVLGAG